MENILANSSTSITELKKNPSAVFSQAMGEPIAVLTHNRPIGYYVPAETFEAIIEKLEDIELAKIANERSATLNDSVEVSLDDL